MKIDENPSEYKSSARTERRSEFFSDMEKLSFKDLYDKYCPGTKSRKIVFNKIKRIVKKIGGVL